MTDSIPLWLAAMREVSGTKWAPGDESNPKIISWLNFIGTAFPKMADYCNSVVHDGDYFSWCGLTIGYCMAKAGIPPLFGSTDTSRFLWAAGWLGWGSPVTAPQPGDVLVFDFGGGDHHVTLFEKDNGNGTVACLGGNQSHQVMLTNFPKRALMGIRRPNVIGAVVQPGPTPVPLRAPSQRFAACVALVLRDEGGNDDDLRDPGGRTSRGITQRDWDVWGASHPGLPSDVWQAPQDQILGIYHQNYWSVVSGDDLPAGVDYAVFDYGVNSGNPRAAKVLQGFVGTDVDGEIGPQTIAASLRSDPGTLIKQICDERLAFLQGLPTWSTFGRGWTRRVDGVRTNALAMVTTAAPAPTPSPVPTPVPMPAPMPTPAPSPSDAVLAEILRRLSLLENAVNSIKVTPGPAAPFPAPPSAPALLPSPTQPTTTSPNDPIAIIERLLAVAQKASPPPGTALPTTTESDALQKAIALLRTITGAPADSKPPPLGQVNGALGETVGNLLNGKKTAVGIGGSLITALLAAVTSSPNAGGLAGLFGTIANSVPGLSQFTLPIFLAISAWGVLGKFEKWTQGSAPPPKPQA